MRRKRRLLLRVAEQIPFRRRGKTYIALIVLILAALAAVSVGIGVREGLEAPIHTVKAVPYESGSGYFSTARPKDRTCVFCIMSGFFTAEPPGKPKFNNKRT